MRWNNLIASNVLVSIFFAFNLSCHDKNGLPNGSDTSSGPAGTPVGAKGSTVAAQFRANLVKRVVCHRYPATEAVIDSLKEVGGVSFPELHRELRHLIAPSSRACGSGSCAKSFGFGPENLEVVIGDMARDPQLPAHLKASLTPPPNGGEWNKSAVSDQRVISGDGELTVFTYQDEKDFLDTVGKSPDDMSQEQRQSLATGLLLHKMENGANGNPHFDTSAVQGYGLYAATDPWQSREFGRYLISFRIRKSAPYVIADRTIKPSQIAGHAFGIIYRYADSETGNRAVVLRLNPAIHPRALPVIPGSVRVYKRDQISPWDSPSIAESRSGGNPGEVFLERYFHLLDYFVRANPRGLSFMMTGQVTKWEIARALESELRAYPKSVADGLARFNKKLNDPEVRAAIEQKEWNSIKWWARDDHLKYFLNRLGLAEGFTSPRSVWRFDNSLVIDTLMAQCLGLVPDGFRPKTYDALEEEIIKVWGTPNRVQVIKQAWQDYQKALTYWKANNLDHFAKNASRANY